MTSEGVAAQAPVDPLALLRSRNYLRLLIIAALLGVPISIAAYFFLQLVAHIQDWVYNDLPGGLGFADQPAWWPLVPLTVAGLLVGLTLRFLPGDGGEKPAEGFKPHGAPAGRDLTGIVVAAVISLGLGAVVGPEAPLIAIGAGLAAGAVLLIKRDTPQQAVALIGAAGSFAAISALFGSPLLGAFLMMEAAGVGGPMLSLVLVPGLLSAGIGALVFIGLDSLTGLGATTLAIPGLSQFTRPDVAQFGWALAIGVLGAFFGAIIRRLALVVQGWTTPRPVLLTPVVGAAVALLVILYTQTTGHSASDVLFSGQASVGPLLTNSADYSVGALLMLLVCKGLGYSLSMSSFRGGPVFPAMFLGAAGGIALSHLPGLPAVAGAAMGIGAMSVAMLRLPLVSVLLATVLLQSDGLAVMPLVIVSVVVSYVLSAHLTWSTPHPKDTAQAGTESSTHRRTPQPGE